MSFATLWLPSSSHARERSRAAVPKASSFWISSCFVGVFMLLLVENAGGEIPRLVRLLHCPFKLLGQPPQGAVYPQVLVDALHGAAPESASVDPNLPDASP